MCKLILRSRHRLFVGDCTNGENVKLLMNGEKPFMMVTDPPYGVKYDAAWREEYRPGFNYATGKVQNDDQADWLIAYQHFEGDVAYVWHAGRFAKTVQANLEQAGFEIRSQIVWNKPVFVFSRGHYHWKHEPCWYAVRPQSSAEWTGDRTQSTVWDIDGMGVARKSSDPGDTKTEHSTQKPIECMARPIRNHGKPDDIVFDPFLGSGTTLIAAHRNHRRCYGFEIEPRYADLILKRAEAEGMSCIRNGLN